MRIIAGKKRGMKLLGPKTFDTRPITDRVKESLFSVLYKYDIIEDGIIADLFCGTGSLGLEALSRGAAKVTFVEINPKVVDILKRNIEKAGFIKESTAIRANALKIGAPVGPDNQKYDLVFVDPPYAMTRDVTENSPVGNLLMLLCDQLADDGIAVVRTHRRTNLLAQYAHLCIIDRRQWSTMAITLLQNNKTKTQDIDTDDQSPGCDKDS